MATESNLKPVIEEEDDLSAVKSSLQKYRDLILPLNKVLDWDKKHYLAILLGLITLVFALIWYFDPFVLTTICLLGIVLSVADFAVPTVLKHLFSSSEWTEAHENQYEEICRRLVHGKQHVLRIKDWLMDLKTNKPTMYLVVSVGVFGLIAWLGSLIDNLLLTYLIVVGISLTPGLRKHGILQLATKRVTELSKLKAT